MRHLITAALLTLAFVLTPSASAEALGDGCAECSGGLTSLSLVYTGNSPALVQLYNKDDDDPDDLLFEGTLRRGDIFTVTPPAGDDKLNNEVSIYVDGIRNADFHTSCSQPIAPGMIEGLFAIAAANSRENGPICAMANCNECEGGITRLSLRYDGAAPGFVQFYNKGDDDPDDLLFEGTLQPGEILSVDKPAGDDKFNNDVSLYVDGEFSAKIHTSCSKPIGPGLTRGAFTVTEAISRANGAVCPVPACSECRGGVTSLTLLYDGTSPGFVQFYNKGDDDPDDLLFEGTLQPGDTFSVTKPSDEDKFNGDVSLYIDGSFDVKIHTSCSQPIGPGTIKGSFIIVEADSKDNGPVCPEEICEGLSVRLDAEGSLIIPPRGGTLTFNAIVTNNTDRTRTFQGWLIERRPDGSVRDPALGPVTIMLAPGETFTRQLSFNVRANARPGQYFCEGAVGYFPNAVCRQGFLWTKVPDHLPGTGGGGNPPPPLRAGPEAITYDGDWSTDASAQAALVLDGTTGLASYPNPFSGATTVVYALAERANVSLKVFDVTGRLVATLADGEQEAGTQQVVLSADGLASGTYLCRLQMGDEVRTHRILIVR